MRGLLAAAVVLVGCSGYIPSEGTGGTTGAGGEAEVTGGSSSGGDASGGTDPTGGSTSAGGSPSGGAGSGGASTGGTEPSGGASSGGSDPGTGGEQASGGSDPGSGGAGSGGEPPTCSDPACETGERGHYCGGEPEDPECKECAPGWCNCSEGPEWEEGGPNGGACETAKEPSSYDCHTICTACVPNPGSCD